ncbi:hypothetical protein BAE44_0024076 [Dichanthelium oligosanthes]|uniref:Senescence domain-containing protein n=1 Tax=Dichanthelium oligosanthes TaxID=888268 RepID=A0A1E5UPW9_9POAL|nr:hypothetical protein BAE44_0024076 [Dichanthelium oligosanthes]
MGCCGAAMSARPRGIREETMLRVPGASVHLMAGGSDGPVELARGDLSVVRLTKDDVAVATAVRVGRDLGWPLARDEPIVRLDRLHYLFTLPDRDGTFLNYGVSFDPAAGADASALASLDGLLRANACFSAPSSAVVPSSKSSRQQQPAASDGYWNDFAPRMESYNGVLAKAIAAGTGQLVKGIFMCSDAYASQVQRGADLFRPQAAGGTSNRFGGAGRSSQASAKRGAVNTSLKRVRKLSEMTELMSQSLLDTVISVTGSMAAPLLRSKQGRAFLATVPGEVVLASLDAINKVMDAVEAAERRSLAATSNVVAGAVSRRYGESAGEATQDAFATAGHAVGTAWNLFKIRKAVTPSSSMPGNMVKTAVRNRM